MKKNLIKLLSLGLLLSSAIACGPGEKRSAKNNTFDGSLFPLTYESDKPGIKGGVYKIAAISDTPFPGIFNPVLYDNNADNIMVSNISPSIFYSDGDFNIIDGGIANMKLDVDKKVITLKFRDDVKWEDGTPLTVDDYIFTTEVIANKDYTGVRYNDSLRNIVGIDEYHSGKAKTISGFKKINDFELEIHVKEANPDILTGTGGLWSSLISKKYFEGVSIAKMGENDKSRLKPLSYGRWKISQVIPGESVEFVPNEYWYEKETMPKVDKLIIKILPSSSALSSMKAGEFDIYKDVSADTYQDFKEYDNIATIGRQALYYFYLGFNLGDWDEAKKINVTDPNKKMADINLRKAMVQAIDLDEIAKQFYGGLREKANGILPPIFAQYYDKEVKFPYDPEAAKKMLDEAGFKDVDGDGIREDKNGKPLKIEFAFPTYDIAEALSQKFIQDWEAVGLKVELVGGRLMGNNFFPTVQSNKGYDIWVAAWSVGSSLNFSGLYGKTAKFNMARITDDKLEKLMAESASVEALKDHDYRTKKVKEVNNYYLDNVLGFAPLLYRYELIPINKRVKMETLDVDSRNNLFPTELTQAEPLPATK